MDDIGWWADGKDDEEVAPKLGEAAMVAIEWAQENGVAFNHGKTQAAVFKRTPSAAMVQVGEVFLFIYSYLYSTYIDHAGVYFARFFSPQPAQLQHVASSPFALRPGLSEEK